MNQTGRHLHQTIPLQAFRLIRLSPPQIAALAACALCILSPSDTHAGNEAGLLKLWESHIASGEDHPAAIRSCQSFARANTNDPFLPVARGLEAWHLLQLNKIEDAVRLLQRDVTPPQETPLTSGARTIALAWTSRVDREQVAHALQLFYRKEVRYPDSLAAVTAHPKISAADHPLPADRFGNPWLYRLVGFPGTTDFLDQRYELHSPTLGNTSDLAKALKLPYASGIDVVPVQILAGAQPLVSIKTGSGVSAVPVGSKAGNVLLAFAGSEIVVVCNHSFWKIFPRP